MSFAHLPVAGGLYDQHPQLLDDWTYILSIKGREQKREHQQRDREMKSKKGSSR